MHKTLWPALAGLFLSVGMVFAAPDPDFSKFSHDDALAYSQAAIGSTVEGIELTRPDGSLVSLSDYRGKPLVISMIFTSCHHICPATTAHLQEVVDKARDVLDEDSFAVVTVGFDTLTDSPERMAQFRRSNDVTDERWEFLSGDADNMARLVRQLGFIYTPSARGFDHLIQSSVLNAEGEIYRQVYGISFPTPHLIEPLKELVFGEPKTHSALDYLGGRIRLFCTVYDPATDSYYIDYSVFIGTFVGLVVSILFGRVLFKEWRRSIRAGK
ncbi:MAG: SCO family protein [Proteobacteria bacterium]|nr:SCO family protein [Pseudomonadota bacterium]